MPVLTGSGGLWRSPSVPGLEDPVTGCVLASYTALVYDASMSRRAARRNPAFRDRKVVTVRCTACGGRLAEGWAIDSATGPGFDVIPFSTPEQPDPWRPHLRRWACRSCGHLHDFAERDLAGELRRADGPRPELDLGEVGAVTLVGPSRDW